MARVSHLDPGPLHLLTTASLTWLATVLPDESQVERPLLQEHHSKATESISKKGLSPCRVTRSQTMEEFRRLEREAREQGRGLWNSE